ncbi:MAG: cysteine hydrolase [Chloroflexota bacterium]|nr:cysteine hydrolase [Chloroflexota bacterium]
MADPLLVVDVQQGFLHSYTHHIPARIAQLIERDRPDPVLFTRFVNPPDGPYHRFLDWHACVGSPETDLAPELVPFATPEQVFVKDGSTGISDELAEELQRRRIERVTVVGIDTDMCVLKVAMDVFDLGIQPLVLIDCCASTAGLQAHLAGLAVLSRNIGAEALRDAGLNGGGLAAPR